jgi:hypothetical protein
MKFVVSNMLEVRPLYCIFMSFKENMSLTLHVRTETTSEYILYTSFHTKHYVRFIRRQPIIKRKKTYHSNDELRKMRSTKLKKITNEHTFCYKLHILVWFAAPYV